MPQPQHKTPKRGRDGRTNGHGKPQGSGSRQGDRPKASGPKRGANPKAERDQQPSRSSRSNGPQASGDHRARSAQGGQRGARSQRKASRSTKSARFDNIVLIGMPGAGKSSIGRALAKWRGMEFVDTDALLRKREGTSLERILKEQGVQGLWDAEARVVCDLSCHNTVVSTGGSVIYRAQSMDHLRSLGVVVFLNADIANLKARLGDLSERGVAVRRGLTDDVDEVYQERIPLYRRYAQVTFRTHAMGVKRAAIVLSQTLDRGGHRKRGRGRGHKRRGSAAKPVQGKSAKGNKAKAPTAGTPTPRAKGHNASQPGTSYAKDGRADQGKRS